MPFTSGTCGGVAQRAQQAQQRVSGRSTQAGAHLRLLRQAARRAAHHAMQAHACSLHCMHLPLLCCGCGQLALSAIWPTARMAARARSSSTSLTYCRAEYTESTS